MSHLSDWEDRGSGPGIPVDFCNDGCQSDSGLPLTRTPDRIQLRMTLCLGFRTEGPGASPAAPWPARCRPPLPGHSRPSAGAPCLPGPIAPSPVPLDSSAYLCELHSYFPRHVHPTQLTPFRTNTSLLVTKYRLWGWPSSRGLIFHGAAFLLSLKEPLLDFFAASIKPF